MTALSIEYLVGYEWVISVSAKARGDNEGESRKATQKPSSAVKQNAMQLPYAVITHLRILSPSKKSK